MPPPTMPCNAQDGAEFLHRVLWELDLPHDYHGAAAADHLGPSLCHESRPRSPGWGRSLRHLCWPTRRSNKPGAAILTRGLRQRRSPCHSTSPLAPRLATCSWHAAAATRDDTVAATACHARLPRRPALRCRRLHTHQRRLAVPAESTRWRGIPHPLLTPSRCGIGSGLARLRSSPPDPPRWAAPFSSPRQKAHPRRVSKTSGTHWERRSPRGCPMTSVAMGTWADTECFVRWAKVGGRRLRSAGRTDRPTGGDQTPAWRVLPSADIVQRFFSRPAPSI